MKDKIIDFIKKHKAISIILILAIILFIVLVCISFSLLFGGSNNSYGYRLDGIDKVKLSSKKLANIEDTIRSNDQVKDANVRLQGRIVYITIDYINGVTVDKAKEIANASLNEFSEDEIAYYDFEYLIKEEANPENSEYVPFAKAATKHPNKEEITWTKD